MGGRGRGRGVYMPSMFRAPVHEGEEDTWVIEKLQEIDNHTGFECDRKMRKIYALCVYNSSRKCCLTLSQNDLKVGLLLIDSGSSFHTIGALKRENRFNESSREMLLESWFLELRWKLFDRHEGKKSLCSFHMCFAFFKSNDFSRGKILKSLYRGIEGSSRFLNDIIRKALFILVWIELRLEGDAIPQLRRL